MGGIAFGIGTPEMDHVLATSALSQVKSQHFLIRVDGMPYHVVTPKDIVLYICCVIGTAGWTNCAIEFARSAIRALSTEAQMSIFNMAIKAGVRGVPLILIIS